jgi:hypothetical protein
MHPSRYLTKTLTDRTLGTLLGELGKEKKVEALLHKPEPGNGLCVATKLRRSRPPVTSTTGIRPDL